MKIGVMGGTFDPLHIGHLIIAQEAGWRLNLDKVVFIPTGDPPHKRYNIVTEASHRLEMVRLATADNPLFEVNTIEVEREGFSYTADTLEELRHQYGEECELYFIIGVDALAEMPNWHRPQRVLELTKLAVLGRPGYELPLDRLREALPGIEQQIVWVDAPMIEIAAQEIRQRVLEGAPIRYLVTPAVEEYIERQQLYTPPLEEE